MTKKVKKKVVENAVAKGEFSNQLASPGVFQPQNGVWIWRIAKIRPDYLEALAALSCRIVYLKVFDDLHGPSFWKDQCSPQLISKFNEKAMKVVGWGYHFDK